MLLTDRGSLMTETHLSSQPSDVPSWSSSRSPRKEGLRDGSQDGGTEAAVLREATRRAGVSPNAAYRHFANREALLMRWVWRPTTGVVM